jgi:acyl carrier protein
MMQQQEILDKLQGVFDSVFLEEVKVSPELSAKDVEEWDSLTHVTLILAIEQEFGIRFRVGEVEATKNLGDLVQLINKCIDRG